MQILSVNALEIQDIQIIRFKKFIDERGYFTETYREDDFYGIDELAFIRRHDFVQFNESFSYKNTFRGFHFQWNPMMGKLVRCISGHLIDMAIDIRKDSQTFGKIVAYELIGSHTLDYSDWMWIPPGFAHGMLLTKDSYVQYLCSGTYNPRAEGVISPLAEDIDWSMCEKKLAAKIKKAFDKDILVKERDLQGMTLEQWRRNKASDKFLYID